MKPLFFFLFFFPVLLVAAQNTAPDTTKVQKRIVLPGKYFSPCDILPQPTLILSHPPQRGGQVTIVYTCFNRTLTGSNKNGKQKWKKEVEKLVLEISAYSFPNKKYDVLLKLQDGSYLMLKSKTGKMKLFEHPGRF